MISEVNAVVFRQNLGEMLNLVQYRKDSIVVNKDGKPVAALVDADLFARIRAMRDRFDQLSSRVAEAYRDLPTEQGMAEIEAAVAAERRGLEVVLSRYILDELVRVLPRLPRLLMTPSEIRDLADSFLFMADVVEPCAERDATLRDEKDQLILGTLIAGQAGYIVTGDKDLLALAERYPIVTPAVFWERHGG